MDRGSPCSRTSTSGSSGLGAGEPVPEAWRIAQEAAAAGDYYGAQDMLLGINAHVQNDMPFVLAALGLSDRDGRSRKPDHDAGNAVLADAYQPVVDAIRERYDASLDLTNPSQVLIDDVAGLEVVQTWREVVWRNAERLADAKTNEERGQVAASIEAYAAGNAQVIARPGRRDTGQRATPTAPSRPAERALRRPGADRRRAGG